MSDQKLAGKTVIVTGANTGIGIETARGLAKEGARVILACRTVSKAEVARDDIISSTQNTNVVVMQLDLASMTSIRKFAEKFNQEEDRLDVLVNNAGVFTDHRQETEDGIEMIFGVNHLGHFLLTTLLLDKLRQSAPSRVVVVSSAGHEMNSVNFDDIESKRKWSYMSAYSQSKTANILFATHLANILKGSGVTTYSLHPGVIQTELARDFTGCCSFAKCFACVWKYCLCRRFLTPEEGAATTLYCALEPSIATDRPTGKYYRDCREARAKDYATNPELAKKLWDISVKMCEVTETT